MSTTDQLKKLLPSFEGAQLKDTLDKALKKINENLLPQYRNLQEVVGDSKFLHEGVKEFDSLITEYLEEAGLSIKSKRKPNTIDYIVETMQNATTIINYLKERVGKDIGRSLLTDGITFNKHTLLQLIDTVDYFTDYATRFLNYITFHELAAVGDSNIKTAKLPPELESELKVSVHTFTITIRVLAMPLVELRGLYGEVPDVIVDEETIGEMRAVFGDKINPLGFSHVPFPLSLIFYARLNIADWQMDRLDETIHTAKAVEYRIAAYEKRKALGEGDAALEKILEIQEKRLADLLYERERMEKKYGLK